MTIFVFSARKTGKPFQKRIEKPGEASAGIFPRQKRRLGEPYDVRFSKEIVRLELPRACLENDQDIPVAVFDILAHAR